MRNSLQVRSNRAFLCHGIGISLALLGCSSDPPSENVETSFQALTSGATYLIVSASGKCVQFAGTTTGVQATLATCSSSTYQQFRFTLVPNQTTYYTIVNVANGQCLDVKGAKTTTSGTVIEQWTCKTSNYDNQQWSVTGTGNGPYPLTVKGGATAYVLDSVDGTNLVLGKASGATSQQFSLLSGALNQGASCSKTAQCAAGYCTNGVCCNAAACPTCLACNVVGRQGTDRKSVV